jgi:hypothetical protein
VRAAPLSADKRAKPAEGASGVSRTRVKLGRGRAGSTAPSRQQPSRVGSSFPQSSVLWRRDYEYGSANSSPDAGAGVFLPSSWWPNPGFQPERQHRQHHEPGQEISSVVATTTSTAVSLLMGVCVVVSGSTIAPRRQVGQSCRRTRSPTSGSRSVSTVVWMVRHAFVSSPCCARFLLFDLLLKAFRNTIFVTLVVTAGLNLEGWGGRFPCRHRPFLCVGGMGLAAARIRCGVSLGICSECSSPDSAADPHQVSQSSPSPPLVRKRFVREPMGSFA